MPRNLDPSCQLKLVLAGDRDKPGPPSFNFRNVTQGQFERLVEFQDRADQIREEGGAGLLTRDVLEELSSTMINWSDMSQPWIADPAKRLKWCRNVLTPIEVWELFALLIEASMLSTADAGKSGSPAQSGVEKSALDAPAADVMTSPAQSSPCSSSAHPALAAVVMTVGNVDD